jgi:hypothetical protein
MNIYQKIQLRAIDNLLTNAYEVRHAAEHIARVDITSIGYGIWVLLSFFSKSARWDWSAVSSALAPLGVVGSVGVPLEHEQEHENAYDRRERECARYEDRNGRLEGIDR